MCFVSFSDKRDRMFCCLLEKADNSYDDIVVKTTIVKLGFKVYDFINYDDDILEDIQDLVTKSLL